MRIWNTGFSANHEQFCRPRPKLTKNGLPSSSSRKQAGVGWAEAGRDTGALVLVTATGAAVGRDTGALVLVTATGAAVGRDTGALVLVTATGAAVGRCITISKTGLLVGPGVARSPVGLAVTVTATAGLLVGPSVLFNLVGLEVGVKMGVASRGEGAGVDSEGAAVGADRANGGGSMFDCVGA
jgi:hypothetical protein